MTTCTQRRVALRPARDPAGIFQSGGHLEGARANLDGALAQALDEGQYPFRMMIIGTDVVVTRLDKPAAADHERGERGNDPQREFRHGRGFTEPRSFQPCADESNT